MGVPHIKIDWSVENHCESCGKALARRSVKAADRGDRETIGSQTGTGYLCRKCLDRAARRSAGMGAMNHAEVSEDGLSQSCNKCGTWYEYSSGMFRTSKKKTRTGYRTTCRLCDRAVAKASRDADPESRRLKAVRQKYGIDYNEVFERQQGRCAICRTDDPARLSSRDNFDVDHDHSCCEGWKSCGACVRGLLCRPCNLLLGIMVDDREKIHEMFGDGSWGRNALHYLDNWKTLYPET